MAIKFDLSSIPAGAKLIKAEMGLYAYGVASGTSTTLKNGSKSIYKITATWAEGTIKWTGAPAASSTALATSSNSAISAWETYNVTSDIKAIVETSAANNGYLLRFPSYNYGVKYRSAEFTTDQTLRPKLTVTYELADLEAPKVAVSAPALEEILIQGKNYSVKWTATDNLGVTLRSIYFSSNGGTSWTKVDSANGNTGTFQWTVPTVNSTNCLIRVDAFDASRNKGTGNSAKFTIQPPSSIKAQWKIPTAEYYMVKVKTVQGREIISFISKDLHQINQKVNALPSGIHVVHIATPDMKFNRKIQFVK